MVRNYKELSDIEFGFRELKDVIEARPVYYRTDERIAAHLFIAQLAFLLRRQLRHHIAEADSRLSLSKALAAVKSIRIVELDLNGQRCLTVSGPKRDAKHVLSSLGISDIYPPTANKHTLKKPQKCVLGNK